MIEQSDGTSQEYQFERMADLRTALDYPRYSAASGTTTSAEPNEVALTETPRRVPGMDTTTTTTLIEPTALKTRRQE